MAYSKVSKTFGDWGHGADEAAHAMFVEHPERGVVHIVDVCSEQEYEENRHRDEWSGWTYVADAEGVAALNDLYAHVEVFDTIGYDPEEEQWAVTQSSTT